MFGFTSICDGFGVRSSNFDFRLLGNKVFVR